MATFSLISTPKPDDPDRLPPNIGLGSAVLVHNVRWFIGVRWVVVAVLLLAGLVSWLTPALVTAVGLHPPCAWTWALAAVLTVVNVLFWMSSRELTEKSADQLVAANIWLQILVDLAVVTLLVHFVGSTSMFIAFTYLFHIVLACIFFAPLQSLLVTLVAATLYLLCVQLEILGLWTSSLTFNRELAMFHALSAVFVWVVVWYLVSSLSKTVRERGRLLEAANQRLIVADEEKNRLMLRTAHDLKAPFSGIESNIQRLKMQHWEQLSAPVREIVDRIEARGKTLSDRIRDILLLGDLRTRTESLVMRERVEIEHVLQEVVAELDGRAQARRVQVQLRTAPLATQGNSRHYFMLFSNLISNAISYSPEGGTAEVFLHQGEAGVSITIRNRGIGITEEALPRIFDEYFRTKEAAQCNPASTGLGLAIVKEIAQKEELEIAVASEVGKETTFSVIIPASRCEFRRDSIPWQKS
ncbi:MAG: HAMP domain-containing sensor histidine kinase [bacterium]